MIEVSALYETLVKSCARVSVSSLEISENGPNSNRYCMIVGPDGKFRLSDEFPLMALIKPSRIRDELFLDASGYGKSDPIVLSDEGDWFIAEEWDKRTHPVVDCGDQAAKWINGFLGTEDFRLVHLPQDYVRTDSRGLARLNLADSWSMSGSGEESLADLNDRIEKNGRTAVGRERFGHDVWFSGAEAYAEDGWEEINVEEKLVIRVVKPIVRCARTLIRREATDVAQLLKKDREPLATLNQYRKIQGEKGVFFGQKMAPRWNGEIVTIGVGDRIAVTAAKPHPIWVVA